MCTVSHVFSQSGKASEGQSTEVKFDLVDITPSPVFARLDRPDDGMGYRAKVFGRVFVLRRIAAADMAACHAQAQMHPDVSHLETFFATACMRFDTLDLVDMRARVHEVVVARLSCMT